MIQKMSKYSYIIYGNTNEFVRIARQDFLKIENVCLMKDPFESKNRVIQMIYKMHTYPQLNRFIELPLKSIWNTHCYISEYASNKPICFIFFAKYATNRQYLHYLKNRYPNCKLVLEFWDLVSKNKKWFPKLSIENIKQDFDLVLSFNKYDCKKYGFTYFNGETHSKQDLKQEHIESDVVFIGRGKGRENKLIKIYDMIKKAGYKPFFYVVNNDYKKYRHDDMIFTNKLMPYMELLQHEVNSRCILELVQDGQYGFSSRAKEAFVYNKKLITDSLIVKDQRFYPSKDICFIEKPEDIDLRILEDNSEVNYGYNDDYSCEKVIELIESVI